MASRPEHVPDGRFVEGDSKGLCGLSKLCVERRTAAGWEHLQEPSCCVGTWNCCPTCCQPRQALMPDVPLPCSDPDAAVEVDIRSVALVFNPAGGSSSALSRWAAVCFCATALRSAGLEVAVIHTEFAGHASRLAHGMPLKPTAVRDPSDGPGRTDDACRKAIETGRSKRPPARIPPSDIAEGREFDCIVVGGGDGTLREVVSGLCARTDRLGATVPVVALPIGTGNSTMLDLGVYRPEDAVRAVLMGRAHRVDAFEVRHPGAKGTGAGVPHGHSLTEADQVSETRIVRQPGSVVGVNVVGALASSDATKFAERNRWLGDLRYDVGGMALLATLPKYTVSVHASQHRLPSEAPLPPDEEPAAEPEADAGAKAGADAGADASDVATSVPSEAEEIPASPDGEAAPGGGESAGGRAAAKDAMPRAGSIEAPAAAAVVRRRTSREAMEVEEVADGPGLSGAAKGRARDGSGSVASARDELGTPRGTAAAAEPGCRGTAEPNSDLFALFIQNTRHSGKGLEVTPSSRLDDGLLDVLTMDRGSRARLLRGFNMFKSGAHARVEAASLVRCRSVYISHDAADIPGLGSSPDAPPGEPLIVMIDGDIWVRTPALVRILPAAWTALKAY